MLPQVTSIGGMDANTFCQTSEDKCLRVWDVRTATAAIEFPKQQYILTDCSAGNKHGHSAGANHILTASIAGGSQTQGARLSLWDVRAAKKLQDFHGHTAGVTGCAFVTDK